MNQPTENDAPSAGKPGFFSLKLRVGPVVDRLAVVACLPVWLGLGARLWWVLELATHFTWQVAVGLALFWAVTLARRRPRLAALVGVSLAIGVVKVAPLYLPAGAAPATTPPMRVMTLNVLTSNRNHQAVVDLIAAEHPDVVALLEVDQRWVEALSALHEDFPYRIEIPRLDNFGIAIYSRREILESSTPDFGAEVPSIVARLDAGGAPLTILATHPLPPSSANLAALRNEQLAAVGQHARQLSGGVVLVGDLNVSPFSPYFHDLLNDSGLVDSGRGYGFQPTWSGRVDLLGIPIDHVLHSPDIAVVDRRVGPDVGSDHRAVIVDLAVSPTE